MNDLLSKDSIQAQLFRPNPTELYHPRYTVYSLGLMFGLFAVAVNIGVGAVATANATLACQFRLSVSTPATQPFTMEARALSCMRALFVSFILSGCSLILLSVEFDPTFTVFVGLVLLGGIAIVAYQPVKGYAKGWVKGFDGNELHLCSLVVSAVAFSVGLARPVEAGWYGGASFLLTVVYHIVEVSMLSRKDAAKKLTRRVPAFCATVLTFVWGGCVVVMVRWQFHLGRVDQVLSYVIASVAGIETIVMGAIATMSWRAVVKNRWNSATSGVTPKRNDEENPHQLSKVVQETPPIAPSAGLYVHLPLLFLM
jgi:hypothetical protein